MISIFVVAAVVVGYFAYGVVKKKYFAPKQVDKEIQKDETQNQNPNEAADLENADQSETSLENGASDEENAESGNSHLYVASKDCDNDCKRFKDNDENFKYCQEVCGIIPVSRKESEDECADLSGLEKDYCLRDVAVSKKNLDICDGIKDTRIEKACENRVAEEIMD